MKITKPNAKTSQTRLKLTKQQKKKKFDEINEIYLFGDQKSQRSMNQIDQNHFTKFYKSPKYNFTRLDEKFL